MDCLVFSPEITPRIRYTFKTIFQEFFGLATGFSENLDDFISFQGVKVNYSNQATKAQEVRLSPCGLLNEQGIRRFELDVEVQNELPFFFKIETASADFDYDIPAMVFFMLSRYEEYWDFKGDRFGRFTAKESQAAKYGFLRMPVVNLWVQELGKCILEKFPEISLKDAKYRFQPTYDIDLAWAFSNRGLRGFAGWLRDFLRLDIKKVRIRNHSLRDSTKDPFHVYDYLRDIHEDFELHPIWFFLMGNYGGVDKCINWKNTEFRELIRSVAPQANVGIHPSFASNDDFSLLEKEIMKLGVIKKGPVIKSRQHYLSVSLPNTYRNLIRAGVKADYTMGFADDIGFRAGIAGEFSWYDLENEKETILRIFPFQVMDVTLKKYLNLSPKLAVEVVAPLIDQVKKSGGVFSTLWHNSSFSALHGWTGWEDVYREIIELGKR